MIACLQEGPYQVPHKRVVGLRPHIQRTAFQDCADATLEASAIWMGGTPVVVLCPRFFTFPLRLAEGGTCLAVDPATNTFVADGGGVHKTMVYALLHELVHVYLGALIRRQRMEREEYAVEDCYELGGARARLNPSNYQFYVNSGLLYFFYLLGLCYRYHRGEWPDRIIWVGVYWGCEHFPKQQLDDSRELKEWHLNYTMIRLL